MRYEYRCTICNTVEVQVHGMKESPLPCGECGSDALKMRFQPAYTNIAGRSFEKQNGLSLNEFDKGNAEQSAKTGMVRVSDKDQDAIDRDRNTEERRTKNLVMNKVLKEYRDKHA